LDKNLFLSHLENVHVMLVIDIAKIDEKSNLSNDSIYYKCPRFISSQTRNVQL